MPFIPADGVGKFELVFSQQGQICENVFHAYKGSGWAEADLTLVCGIIKSWWDSHYKIRQTSACSLMFVRGHDMSTETSPGVEYAVGLPSPGSNGALQLPMNVTVAIKLVTGLSGRSYRGRYYFVGLTPAAVSGSTLVAGVAGDFQSDALALMTALSANGTPLVVVSYRHDRAPRTAAVYTPVTGAVVNTTTDSQRRRLPERGS